MRRHHRRHLGDRGYIAEPGPRGAEPHPAQSRRRLRLGMSFGDFHEFLGREPTPRLQTDTERDSDSPGSAKYTPSSSGLSDKMTFTAK
jgi:hypothetical protein